MGRLVYFKQGESVAPLERRAEWGLGYVGGGPQVGCTGPTGHRGVLFSNAEGSLSDVNMDPARWVPVHGVEGVLVTTHGVVTPRDLERERTYPGHWVEMADGKRWLLPAVRRPNGTTCFPKALRYEGGAWVEGDVEARWRELWQRSCELWDKVQAALTEGHESLDVPDQDLFALAADALSANYRVGASEISALGLLNTHCAGEAAMAVIDWPTVRRAMEGKAGASAGQPGAAGGGG